MRQGGSLGSLYKIPGFYNLGARFQRGCYALFEKVFWLPKFTILVTVRSPRLHTVCCDMLVVKEPDGHAKQAQG